MLKEETRFIVECRRADIPAEVNPELEVGHRQIIFVAPQDSPCKETLAEQEETHVALQDFENSMSARRHS